MDDHRRLHEMLAPYVLGELDRRQELELKLHLQQCPPCKEEEDELRAAHNALRGAAVRQPPRELKSRVVRNLPRRSSPTPFLAVAAALAVILVLGFAYTTMFRAEDASALTATFSPTELAPGAGGELKMEPSGNNLRVRLEVWGLPEPRPSEYYELWLAKDGRRISCGGFTVDSEGRATIDTNAPPIADEYPRVGITREKVSGDPRPSNNRVLGGELR